MVPLSITSNSPVEKPVRDRSKLDIELRQLDLQQIEIPPRPEGDLVVGNAQRTLLRFGEAREHDGRHFGKAQRLRRQQATMPGNYRPVRDRSE